MEILNTMLKTQRHEVILREIQSRGQLSMRELSTILTTTEITVRRDLDELDQAGQIKRIRGGAQRLTPCSPEPPVVLRQLLQSREKKAIGLKALDLVAEGEVIAIEAGSTTLELARAIAQKSWQNLQVATNSFLIHEALIHAEGVSTIFLGGVVNRDERGTFGMLAEEVLRHLRFNKLFVGCRGIDADGGITYGIEAQTEAATIRAMAAATNQTFILADHTKLGQIYLIRLLPASAIAGLVVDDQAPAGQLAQLREKGVQVLPAPVAPNTE
jgi:DeoR family fructose operon transcriptional repressor